jgi:FkbM family methyltransferase
MNLLRVVGMEALAWVDTRRSAVATIKWLNDRGVVPKTIVDAGANNSQWASRLSREWPGASVVSFEPQEACRPMGLVHRCGLSDEDGVLAVSGSGTSAVLIETGSRSEDRVAVHRLDRYASEFKDPAVLKVDTEDHTYRTLLGAGDCLKRFACVVVEIWEGLDAPCEGRNRHVEIHALMWRSGFNRAMTVGAMPWRNHVSITDALFWKE